MFSQEKANRINRSIKLINANKISMDHKISKDIQILTGNVIFEHEGVIIKCDSSIFINKENTFNAYKNVKINQGDTLTMTCKHLKYNGFEKKGYAYEDVVMKNKTTTLYTEEVIFDRNINEAVYPKYGKIIDSINVLESQKGIYFTDKSIFQFLTNVVITNPRYIINSENLLYNTDSKISYFKDSSTITSDSNFIYTEKGEYNTITDISFFTKNSYIQSKEQILYGDSLYYDRNKGFGSATDNVKIIDTLNNTFITAGYAEIFENKDSVIIYKTPIIHFIDEKNIDDTLFIYTDTLLITKNIDTIKTITKDIESKKINLLKNDSINILDSIKIKTSSEKDTLLITKNIDTIKTITKDTESKKISLLKNDSINILDSIKIKTSSEKSTIKVVESKIIRGYYRMKFYRKDIQGLCDSIHYNETTGVMKMMGRDPVIWSDRNQMTGDTIYLIRKKTGELDSVKLMYKAFIISQDEKDSTAFNQIKGRVIKGKVIKNKLKRIWVLGNAETLYYVDNEDGERQGINKSQSSRMFIKLDNSEIEEINFLDTPKATMFPESKIPMDERKLKRFILRNDERIKCKNDIFPKIQQQEKK